MKIDRAHIRQQFAHEDEPLIHELQVVIVRPDVGILRLLKDRMPLRLQSCRLSAQFHLADVIRAAIERRIDADEVDFPAEPLHEQGRKNLLIIPVKNQIGPAIKLLYVSCMGGG